MNILIVGGGHLGRKIAEELDHDGHLVAVIEENEDKLALLSNSFEGVTFHKFPMDMENLISAGIESCDAVAVTTSDDNLNITVGQMAKRIFNVKCVVSRISDPMRESVFENFGLQTVCPTNTGGQSIINALTSAWDSKEIRLGSNTVSFEAKPVEKRMVGKLLSNIYTEKEMCVLGLLRDGKTLILNSSSEKIVISSGDSIVYSKKID